MADAPAPAAADGGDAPAQAMDEPAANPRQTRRWAGEGRIELFAIPVLVGICFLGYVWWRQTAELDSIEESALSWRAIWEQLVQHLKLTVVSSVIVVLVAVPAGIALTRGRLRVAAPAVVGIANFGQAAPSVGLIVLLYIWLQTQWSGFWIAVLALSLYGILPVLRNTITGLQGVDPTLVEAGRGLGMSANAVLWRIELPLALPVIMSGVRTSLVLIVGTASLATFIGAGGLGSALTSGINLFRFSVIVSAALLIALLALLVEWLGRVLELTLRPKGI